MLNVRPKTDRRIFVAAVVTLASVFAGARPALAGDLHGRVTFAALAVPGASVTATRSDLSRTTVTDDQGIFRFVDLADGPWTIAIEMLGFSPVTQDVFVSAATEPLAVSLALVSFDKIGAAPARASRTEPTPLTARPATPAASPAEPPNAPAVPAAAPVAEAPGDRSADAAEGFLVNGSVNNSAASPFAQLPAFGNNRRGPRSLYSGGFGALFGNSALDASPFSFTGQPTPKPSYSDIQLVGSFAGPVKLPAVRNKANLFLGYQHTANNEATTQSALVPTDAERRGDFSQSVDASGRPVRIVDPLTGLPFPGNAIPSSRLSPQATSLLALYPTANVGGTSGYNFQTPVVLRTTQDAVQARFIESLSNKTQIYGTVSFQRTAVESGNLFGFADENAVSGVDAPITWSHRYSQFFTLRVRYQLTWLATETTPFFAERKNVAADAGIGGTDPDPRAWGPPMLTFSSGVASLSTAQYASNHDLTHAFGAESQMGRGRHTVTFGGDARVRRVDVVSQLNSRGNFAFTGTSSGSDVADFMLGIPRTAAIAYGNADKNLRASGADAYVTDDWRVNASLTANVGVRWEFESPFTEALGRLINLDIAPGFVAAARVDAANPVGPITGDQYPASLVRPDYFGVQPRVGIAWRPIAGSSVVVRGGYGVYRNASVYQAMDLLLAQQPPLSTTVNVENTGTPPLTMANAFLVPPGTGASTFAIDPDLRVGYAHNWQMLVQRDLPASLAMSASYLGTLGRHQLQEFLPNTYPAGAPNPCPTCPIGFVYLTSNGTSSRHAAQFQLRRRLHNGLAASLQYTLAHATDDAAAAFTGATLGSAAVVQDWLAIDADRAPSSFDQRHLIAAQVQYTSGVGASALLDGFRGALLKGWTLTAQLTTGSGLPLTPIYLAAVPGTAMTGTIRGDLTGAPTAPSSEGSYANPEAYAAPAAGHWGDAGRNSIRGPAQFSLNAGLGRSFLWGQRLTFDWRFDAINLLNTVTYSGVNTIVDSRQFGLPTQANTMRKLRSTIRIRF